VLWVKWEGRPGLVALDTCARFAGDVGIQVGLLGVEPRAVRVAGGASYREHICPKGHRRSGLSFTGAAPTKKRPR
jgi:hypothetical protein